MLKSLMVVVMSLFLGVGVAQAERIKELTSVSGIRPNQLIGYGLVVGLDGSGDQTTQTPFTTQSLKSMLGTLGVSVPPETALQLKNVAAVMVTASLPAFSQPGQQIDITVSSMGNAKSLRGGTLLMTPLKGADGQVYAMAQGSLVVGTGGSGSSSGGQAPPNNLLAGRVPSGATVERAVPTQVGSGDIVQLEANTPDFATVQKIVEAINRTMGNGTAVALDGKRIQVKAPLDSNQRVSFLGRIENIEVRPAAPSAKVIVNSRTGSVVMNQAVKLEGCSIAHGNLSVTVNPVGQATPGTPETLYNIAAGTNLADVVKALNSVGANAVDLAAILQAMKAAGALHAELEVI